MEYKNDRIDDVYIIRVYYTADDLGNLTMAGGLDVYGENNTDTYGDSLSGDEWSKYYTLENRTCSYVDFWILPEGVSTVLNYANGIQKDGDAWYYYKDGVVDNFVHRSCKIQWLMVVCEKRKNRFFSYNALQV